MQGYVILGNIPTFNIMQFIQTIKVLLNFKGSENVNLFSYYREQFALSFRAQPL